MRPIHLLLMGLFAISTPAMADALDIPASDTQGLSDAQVRQVYRTQTIREMPGIVLATEEGRLGLPPVAGTTSLKVAPGHSVLMDCPVRNGSVTVVSQTVFARNLDDLSLPMTAHVNTILAMDGCPFHEVVELNVAYDHVGVGVRMDVSDYVLGVARN